MAKAHYAKDFGVNNTALPKPTTMDVEDGDGLVPLRSCIRGQNSTWAQQQVVSLWVSCLL